MKRTTDRIEVYEQRRHEMHAELAQVGDMRQGSLVERYRKCGKPTCHCAAEGAQGHGPSYSLTRKVRGKTVTHVIPSDAVAETRQQLGRYKRFRKVAGELVEVNEALCDARLDARQTEAEATVKKGASKRRSTMLSRRKSTPS